MTLKGIKYLVIAKEPFKRLEAINTNLDKAKWEQYISEHQDYYTWFEETVSGIKTKQNINQYPEDFREGLLSSLQKRNAHSEFDKKKGYYKVILGYNTNYSIISITMSPVKPKKFIERLERFLDLANYMDAYLLVGGNKIVTKEFLNKEKAKLTEMDND